MVLVEKYGLSFSINLRLTFEAFFEILKGDDPKTQMAEKRKSINTYCFIQFKH